MEERQERERREREARDARKRKADELTNANANSIATACREYLGLVNLVRC